MSLAVRPQREDYFPKTRRGHGSINRGKTIAGVVVKEATHCVDSTCQLNMPKSKNLHVDAKANLKDWCDERRLSVHSKERKHARYSTPMEALYAATGGAATQ